MAAVPASTLSICFLLHRLLTSNSRCHLACTIALYHYNLRCELLCHPSTAALQSRPLTSVILPIAARLRCLILLSPIEPRTTHAHTTTVRTRSSKTAASRDVAHKMSQNLEVTVGSNPSAPPYAYRLLAQRIPTRTLLANMAAVHPGALVLITGVNGHVASTIALRMLEEGYKVRGTVRKLARAAYVRKEFAPFGKDFEIIEVPDVAADGAFDGSLDGRPSAHARQGRIRITQTNGSQAWTLSYMPLLRQHLMLKNRRSRCEC